MKRKSVLKNGRNNYIEHRSPSHYRTNGSTRKSNRAYSRPRHSYNLHGQRFVHYDSSSSSSSVEHLDHNYRSGNLDNHAHYRTYDDRNKNYGDRFKLDNVQYRQSDDWFSRLNLDVPYVNPTKTYTKNNRKS